MQSGTNGAGRVMWQSLGVLKNLIFHLFKITNKHIQKSNYCTFHETWDPARRSNSEPCIPASIAYKTASCSKRPVAPDWRAEEDNLRSAHEPQHINPSAAKQIHVHTDENIEYLTQILQDAMKTGERKDMKPKNNRL